MLGIARRSGTNYLARLLQAHPDCVAPAPPLAEDHLLRDADRLVSYVEVTAARRPLRWGPRVPATEALLHHLGAGLVAYLHASGDGRRVVTKTPSLDNFALAPTLLPGANVVVLLRDGRAVTESLVRGFRLSYERAMREWQRGARIAAPLVAEPRADVLVVRYEDLTPDPTATLEAIFAFAGLDKDRYDFEAARSAPVFGSSFVREDSGDLIWGPVDRSRLAEVDHRTAWPAHRQARFDQLAGELQAALGYERGPARASTPRGVAANVAWKLGRPFSAAWDGVFDARKAWKRRRAEREVTEQP